MLTGQIARLVGACQYTPSGTAVFFLVANLVDVAVLGSSSTVESWICDRKQTDACCRDKACDSRIATILQAGCILRSHKVQLVGLSAPVSAGKHFPATHVEKK